MRVTKKLINKWKKLTSNNFKLQLSNGKSYNGEWKIIEHFYHPKYEWHFYAIEYYSDEQKFYGLNKRGKEGYFSIDSIKEFNKTHEPIVRDLKWKHPMVGIHFKWKNMKNWRKYESKII